MIIRPKNEQPVKKTTTTANTSGIVLFVFVFVATLVVIIWAVKDDDKAVSMPDVAKISNQAVVGDLKTEVSPARQAVPEDVSIRPDRQTLAEQNNVIERDALKIGEKQADPLRRKLEEKPDLSAQERSNLVHTIQKLESGQITLQ